MLVKYDKICRICLAAKGLYKLSELSEYCETFIKITDLSQNNKGSFPDNICQRCKMYLKICHKFRLTAIESNEKLESFLSNANKSLQLLNFNTEAVNNLNFDQVKILLSKEDRIEIINLEKSVVNKNLETAESTNYDSSINNFVECSAKKTESEEQESKEEYLDDCYVAENGDNLDNIQFFEDAADDSDCSQDIIIDNTLSKKGLKIVTGKVRKFKEFWLHLYKPWLININGKAYCKYCGVDLENILAHIKRHSHTTKHEKNTLIFTELNKQDGTKLKEKLSIKTDNIKLATNSSIVTKLIDEKQNVINTFNNNTYQSKIQVRRFKEYWLDIYKPWLCEINGQAHCRYCCSKIENILRHIERHLSTSKHKRNAIIYLESGKEIPSEEKILEFLKTCKQNACDYCEKTYLSKELLDSHINKIHVDNDGAARFQCAQCNKKFSLMSTIKNHLKTHPIHKPVFTCYNCKEKFARKGTLKNHMFQCIENFESGNCSDCNMHFKDFDSYLFHFNVVHKTPDFDVIDENCWICGNNYKLGSELREHLLDHDIIQL